MARKEPYTELNDFKRINDIESNKREKLPASYSLILRVLVDYLLTLDQIKRPNIEQILRYPIVRAELENILKDLTPLTYNFPTAMSAHLV
jgi:hypothetical protein